MTLVNRSPVKAFLFYLTTAGTKLATSLFSKSVTGVENLPKGAYVIAANHRSLVDGVIVVNEFNRVRRSPIHMIAYEEPFFHPLWGPLLRISGCLPFNRGDKDSRANVLKLALGFLREGEPVAIFPEGHLSPSNKMRRSRPGVAILALESGLPVVPVGLRGTEKVLPPNGGRLKVFGRQASIEIGKPVYLDEESRNYLSCQCSKRRQAILSGAGDKVMRAIAALSGQSYPY